MSESEEDFEEPSYDPFGSDHSSDEERDETDEDEDDDGPDERNSLIDIFFLKCVEHMKKVYVDEL